MPPGELIYLNLPLHPGSKLDKQPPTAPARSSSDAAENMGYPGVELHWKPGTDDNWISCYEVFRNGRAIDKVAKGPFYFDHSAGADLAARYQVRTVDGAGNLVPSGRGCRANRSCRRRSSTIRIRPFSTGRLAAPRRPAAGPCRDDLLVGRSRERHSSWPSRASASSGSPSSATTAAGPT